MPSATFPGSKAFEEIDTFSFTIPTERRVKDFAESLDKWKEEADQSIIPPFILSLISTPVKDLHWIQCPQRVSLIAPLSDVIEVLQSVRCVAVQQNRGEPTSNEGDLLYNRMTFLEHALAAPDLSNPVSSLLNRMPPLGWIEGHETLDCAAQRMLSTGFDEVGVMDGGIVTGVLHIDDIYTFLSKERIRIQAFSTPGFKVQKSSEEQCLLVQSSADVRRKIDTQRNIQSMSPLRLSAQMFCRGSWTELLIVGCIILDIACSIAVFDSDDPSDIAAQKVEVATGLILFVFSYEALVRIFGFRNALLRLPFEMIDLSIVAISVIVYSMVLRSLLGANSKSILTLARIIRGLRMFKVLKIAIEHLAKRRMLYHKDGFALDLSFITKSCIAMSQPAVGSQANFANPIEEVYRFFRTKYPDRFLIFNLCSRETYSDDYFEGRVERIAVEKHNPPKLSQIVAFVESAGKFLDEDPKACIAVHCKEGRARTGVMVSAWLMYSKFAESADDAMKWFVTQRVSKSVKIAQGIPMPSQRRYVHYMEEALRLGGYYTKRLLLQKIVIQTCPMMDEHHGCNLWFNIEEDARVVHSSLGKDNNTTISMTTADLECCFPVDYLVSGDIRITFYNREPDTSRDELCFFFNFHTGFIPSVKETISKNDVDVASTDSKCKVFQKEFAVHLEFDHIPKPGNSLTKEAILGGTALGPFRKILKPSQKIVDTALSMRGRDLRIQIKAATRLQRKILFNNSSSSALLEEELKDINRSVHVQEESQETICCASGPVVTHDSVELYKHDDASVGMANLSSLRFSASKYFSQTIGAKIARSWVSGNKRRFIEDGFDLDLSYITARIIAMGFPSSGIESSYRNSKEDVYRFFQHRHAAHYRIVNLCSEREYLLDTFHGNCVRYPFDDHHPPALELLLPCCAHIHKYLQADPDNVIAIHCKAGKGRTGLVVICYLLYCGFKCSALEARSFYDWARTTDGKGVTIISQIRYAHYFEHLLRTIKEGKQELLQTAQNKAPAIVLHKIRLHTVPHFNGEASCNPALSIFVKSEEDHEDYPVFDGHTARNLDKSDEEARYNFLPIMQADRVDLIAGMGVRVAGDFKVNVSDISKSITIFFFYLHSAFVVSPPPQMGGKYRKLTKEEIAAEDLPSSAFSLTLFKYEIDRAAKDIRCAHFDPDFKVELFFSPLPGQQGTGDALTLARQHALEKNLSAEAKEAPLKSDREAYQLHLQSSPASESSSLSFESWLLGRERDLECSVSRGDVGLVDECTTGKPGWIRRISREFTRERRSSREGLELSLNIDANPTEGVHAKAHRSAEDNAGFSSAALSFQPSEQVMASLGYAQASPSDTRPASTSSKGFRAHVTGFAAGFPSAFSAQARQVRSKEDETDIP